MWSSQNEQDSRYIAQQGYFPVLEPSNPQEAKDMMVDAYRLSEEFKQPFMVRSVMRVSHGRSDVVLGKILREKRTGLFPKDINYRGAAGARFRNRKLMIEKLKAIGQAANGFSYNRLTLNKGAKLGVIACGLSYSYALDAMKDMELSEMVSILKIGTPYPLLRELVKTLLNSVEEVLVIEELEPFVETQIKAIAQEAGIMTKIHGKDLLPTIGELSPRLLMEAFTKLTKAKASVNFVELDKIKKEVAPLLPIRPPILCAGCSHRASFSAITIASKKVARERGEHVEPIYPSDIGCYIMGRLPPLYAGDTVVSMGGSFGISCGIVRATDAPIVTHLGDSTFFHAGIPAMINAVFNKAKITMVVLDNSATAMTGFQPHPGTGLNAIGEPTVTLKVEDVARGCGVQFVEVVDPVDNLKRAIDTVEKAIRFEGPSMVVFQRTCAQIEAREKRRIGLETVPYQVNQEKCSKYDSSVTQCLMFPCEAACPAGNDIKGYLELVKQGKLDEAFYHVRKTNPLPAVLGRVCYHPCETECNRGSFDESIAIHSIERFLGDYGLTAASKKRPAVKKQEKVAIVGSGPAGLSSAYQLAMMGYGVTMFESLPVPGGMLVTGIPEYRLPKEILRAEIKAIKDIGVEIRTSTPVHNIDRLLEKGYGAVFLAVGAQRNMRLGVPGEEADNVFPALDFLQKVNLGSKISIGDSVGVVGGGNVAIDATRSALRLGAKEVVIFYRRTKQEMPASVEEVEAAEAEGVEIQYLVSTVEILTRNDKVSGMKCLRMKLGEPDASGRRRPEPVKGSEFDIGLDMVIPAIGQTPALSFLDRNSNVKVSEGGTLLVDAKTMATSRTGVFAGGDAVTGPATVAEAIGAGRKASISIDKYLRGVSLDVVREQRPLVKFEDLNLNFILPASRVNTSKLPAAERVRDFTEVDSGLSREAAICEAKRCLVCGVGSEICITRLGCPAIFRDGDKTVIEPLLCNGCGLCAQVCPHKAIEQEQNKW